MLARVRSAALDGIEALPVDIEVDIHPVHGVNGKAVRVVVGLPDAGVREGRDRIESAIRNSGYPFPEEHVVVNLAPADLRKEGAGYDLPIAAGILAAAGFIGKGRIGDYGLVGELALDGSIRPVRGALALALAAVGAGFRGLIVPRESAAEAGRARRLDVVGVGTLAEAVGFLNGRPAAPLPRGAEGTGGEAADPGRDPAPDMADVFGQEHARRALLVAAAGAHPILFTGPPGSGKTLLAHRLPTILPDLDESGAMEVTRIHGAAGILPPGSDLVLRPPFRAPHHTVSYAGLAGGGVPPRPGEVTLAHRGVLFLDELPEFQRRTLEVLRQPLEGRIVTLARASGTAVYPADFLFAAAMNPCPCGWHGDPRRACRCSPRQRRLYRARVSGPLLDRIDIHIEVPSLPPDAWRKGGGESSRILRERVVAARRTQAARPGGRLNSERSWSELAGTGSEAGALSLLEAASGEWGLSARARLRILRVARTLADLEERERVAVEHVSEALQYRQVGMEPTVA